MTGRAYQFCPTCHQRHRGRCPRPDTRTRTDRVTKGERWDRERTQYLEHHPRCAHCGARATDVHHTHRIQTTNHDPWDWEQWQALCHPCHSKETAKEVGLGNKKKNNAVPFTVIDASKLRGQG